MMQIRVFVHVYHLRTLKILHVRWSIVHICNTIQFIRTVMYITDMNLKRGTIVRFYQSRSALAKLTIEALKQMRQPPPSHFWDNYKG